MKKTALSFLILTFSNACIYAQDYFVKNRYKDTVFCKFETYSTNSQGYLVELIYVDASGNQVTIEGKKKLMNVDVLRFEKTILERMPIKIDKPYGYVRYGVRKVNGKLQVLVYNNQRQEGKWEEDRMTGKTKYETYTAGSYFFYLKLPDGKLLDVRKRKVVKNEIKPYLLNCKEFEKAYSGDFSNEEKEFIEMIKLYNSVCQ